MKIKSKKSPVFIIGTVVVAITMATFSSCHKSDSNTSFTGTYYGTLATGIISEADTITITAGNTSSDIVMNSKTDRGSTYTITGTVNGKQLNIPSQQVYVANLSATYTVTGSGSLDNSTLTINYAFESSSQSYTYLTFNGTKQ